MKIYQRVLQENVAYIFECPMPTKGAKTFSAQNITGVNVVWDCGQELKNLLADAEFNLVATRSAQAALLKAIKDGSNTVDLTKPEGDGRP